MKVEEMGMDTKRIEEIQKETVYPDSRSVQQALLKVWNECEQEKAALPHVSKRRGLLIAFDWRKTTGVACLLWAAIFAHLETKHFGNNWFPQTNEEIICDATSLLLFAAGAILLWQKRK